MRAALVGGPQHGTIMETEQHSIEFYMPQIPPVSLRASDPDPVILCRSARYVLLAPKFAVGDLSFRHTSDGLSIFYFDGWHR